MEEMKRRISLGLCGACVMALLSLASITAVQRAAPLDQVSSSYLLPDSTIVKHVPLPDGRWLDVYGSQGKAFLTDALHTERLALPEARRFGTVTVMPSGQVLLWGGVDAQGRILEHGQWFDPTTLHFVRALNLGLPARAGHTLTVLSDGRLLLTGGWVASGVPATQALLWDFLKRDIVTVGGEDMPRFHASTQWEADGSVRIDGGVDPQGRPVNSVMRFMSTTRTLTKSTSRTGISVAAAVSISPAFDAGDTPLRGPLAVRFGEPASLRELAAGKAVKLLGPNGIVPIQVVGVEGGRLAFVQLRDDLYPGSRYTLFVQGLHTAKGTEVPYTAVGFTTARLQSGVALTGYGAIPATTSSTTPSTEPPLILATGDGRGAACDAQDIHQLCRDKNMVKDGAWYPGRDNASDATGGHWRLYHPRQTMPDTKMQELNLDKDATALIGQVRRIDESPVANVEISIGDRKARTDTHGVFVLDGLTEGRQEVFVDGRTASLGNLEYGRFLVGADIKAATRNHMPFVMYLPRVLARDKIALPSPTSREVVVTHPDMPGLELHIPAGTVFKDRDGKVLTELAVVPTPVDHAPFPLPANFPMYFTIQPGDAVVQGLTANAARGIRVVYPNYGKAPPQTAADFWVYNIKDGWQMYGAGRITADAKQLAPDPGVSLVWALGAGASVDNADPPGGRACNGAQRSQPVDLQTGMFFHEWTDLAIRDVVPLTLSRSYRSDDNKSHVFGVGGSSNLGMHLYSADGFTTPQLVMPCGEGIAFKLISGTANWPFTPATVWQHAATDSSFYGATLQFLFDDTSDGAHWVLTMKDGRQYAFTRHAPNQLVWMQDRFGNATQLHYNGGLIDQVISPSGRSIAFSYDGSNRIVSAVDHSGRQVSYAYNNTGSLNRVTYADGTNEQYTYDTNRRLLTMQDRRGNVWVSNQYDDKGRVTLQTLSDNTSYQFAYTIDTNQQVTATTVTDPNGHQERVAFDPVSHYALTDTWAYGTSLAQTVTYTRRTSGLIDALVDPLGRKTTYDYDNLGNVTAITRLAGTAQAVTYQFSYTPDYSQLASVTDPLSHTTSFSYSNGCLAQVVDPLGHATTMVCNSAGQPTAIEDALGHLTTLSYEGYDLQAITDALNRTRSFTVDVLGRRVAVKDPLGNVALVQYDTNDRVTQSVDGLNQTTAVSYDGNGNPLSVALPNNKVIANTYDTRNRRITRTDALNQHESWTYDGMGQPLSYTDRKNQVTLYSHDALNRRTLVSYADGSGTQATYDNGNRQIGLLDTVSGSLSWSYNDLDQMIQAVTPQGTISYSYDAAGRRTSMVPAAQAAVSYRYDNANRLLSITQGSEVVTLGYDDSNRRTRLTLPNGIVVNYGYDSGNQLNSLVYAQGNGSRLGDLSYGYNMVGQIITQSGSLAFNQLPMSTNQASTFDANNRQTGFNGATLSYDANGNLTSDGTNTFVWNARNQLVEIQQVGATKLSYAYDAMGRRVSKTMSTMAPTQYLYDGLNTVQENEGGNINPILVGLGIDERFARNDVTGRTYFLSDMLGSTIGLTDSLGVIKQRYTYDPYGNVSQTDTSIGFTNPYQYTGREADTAGLYYYRARYYSPGMGRFISEDPLGLTAGLNSYAYVGGDPLNYIDPLGLWALTPDQQAAVAAAAKDWSNSNVPYVFGGSSKKGADCSGSVSSIFDQAGIPLGRKQSQQFKQSPFGPVPAGAPLEVGDVGVYPGHVVIYGGDTGQGKDVWSASHTNGPAFGPANSAWYGTPVWYRYNGP